MPKPQPSVLNTRLEGPAPEVEVSLDMVKRGLIAAHLSCRLAAIRSVWSRRSNRNPAAERQPPLAILTGG